MNIIAAQNTEADFRGFVTLDTEFNRAYDALGIGEQYGRITAEEVGEDEYRVDFDEHIARPRSRFFLAKDGDRYVGYLFGGIEAVNDDGYHTYRVKEVGYIESLAVSSATQGQGVSSRLRDAFFEWLKSEGITICRVSVKVKNGKAADIYRHWGFEADEMRMWRRLD